MQSRKDIVYVNTDCFVCPKDSLKPEIDGYEIKNDYEFEFLYIYNQNKWLGKTINDRVEYRGFKRLNSSQPKIFHIAREEILTKIRKTKDKEEFMEIIDESDKLISKTLKELKKYPEEYFSIKVRKKDDYCKDMALVNIWKKLNIGFSNIFLDKNGEYTLKFDNDALKTYKEEILNLAKEYSTTKE